MSARTSAGAIVAAIQTRALAGLPEPGEHYCSWCGGPAAVFVDVVRPDEIATARFVCPCCSPPGCPHRHPDCGVCGRSTAPAGTYASGGPYVRCDGSMAHGAEA